MATSYARSASLAHTLSALYHRKVNTIFLISNYHGQKNSKKTQPLLHRREDQQADPLGQNEDKNRHSDIPVSLFVRCGRSPRSRYRLHLWHL